MTRIPAITLHRPWPSLILFGGKRVENRGWGTNYRGPVYVHAGKAWDDTAIDFAATIPATGDTMAAAWISEDPREHPTGIVGMVDLVDICDTSTDRSVLCDCGCGPWAVPGARHWRLEKPRTFPEPVPCLGFQGLWWPSALVVAAIPHIEETAHA